MLDDYGRRLLHRLANQLSARRARVRGDHPGFPPVRDTALQPWQLWEYPDRFEEHRALDNVPSAWTYDEVWRAFFGHTFGDEYYTRDCHETAAEIRRALIGYGMPKNAAAFWAEEYLTGGAGWRDRSADQPDVE